MNLNPMDTLFFEHPRQEGMTYWEHFQRAAWLGGRMAVGSVCLLVHAVIPAFCEKAGSGIIRGLYEEIDRKKADTKKEQ